MRDRRPHLIRVLFALTCLFIVIGLSACPPPERYEGTYVAVESETSPHAGAVLALEDDSQGTFQSREQEVSFRWSVRATKSAFIQKKAESFWAKSITIR